VCVSELGGQRLGKKGKRAKEGKRGSLSFFSRGVHEGSRECHEAPESKKGWKLKKKKKKKARRHGVKGSEHWKSRRDLATSGRCFFGDSPLAQKTQRDLILDRHRLKKAEMRDSFPSTTPAYLGL
jgi:hypothetical protein